MWFHWWGYRCLVLLSSPQSCSWFPSCCRWCVCSISTVNSCRSAQLLVHHQRLFLLIWEGMKPKAWIKPCAGHHSKAHTAPQGSRTWIQFNWGHDSVGIILIVFRGVEKGCLVALVGPLPSRTGGAEGTRRTSGPKLLTLCKQSKGELPVHVGKGSGPARVVL